MSTPHDYATHPDWFALVRGICEEPAADLPRLVAADWLDGFDTPDSAKRARFIRADVGMAATGLIQCPRPVMSQYGGGMLPCHQCDYCLMLIDRWDALKPHSGSVPACPDPSPFVGGGLRPGAQQSRDHVGPRAYAHRGFYWSVYCSLADFLAHAPALFRAQPITRVVLTDREPRQVITSLGPFGRGLWYWWNSPTPLIGDNPSLHHVPKNLMTIMLGRIGAAVNRDRDCHGAEYIFYPTQETAFQALSWASVTHGRRLNGLTDLPAPVSVNPPPYLEPSFETLFAIS